MSDNERDDRVELTVSLTPVQWIGLREACRAYSGERGAASAQIDVEVGDVPDQVLGNRTERMLADPDVVCDVIASRIVPLTGRRTMPG